MLANPWCYLENGAYVIENVTTDASSSPIGSGILINNSQNVDFIIRNCTITGANGTAGYINYGGGIIIINSSRGIIYNNTCTDGGQYGCGILAYAGSFNIAIKENIVRNNNQLIF